MTRTASQPILGRDERAGLHVGQSLWALTRPAITRTDIVRYAGASGDFTPVHHDDTYARNAGNPSVFAMGLYPAGILASQVTQHFGPIGVRRFSIRFTDKIWPGDILTYRARVIALGDEIELELSVSDQYGTSKLTGSATLAN